MSHRVYIGGKVHVRARRCSTCIFGPNSPVSVERRDGMVERAADDGCIPCHAHLYQGAAVEPVCRGFYEQRGNLALRLAEAMGVIEWHDDEP